MAVLSENDRASIWADWMRENLDSVSDTKQTLRTLIDATDQWINDNSGSYNSALNTAATNSLTAKQKAMLFMYVGSKRFGIL